MRFHRLAAVGVAVATAVAAAITGSGVAGASSNSSDSLRALASEVGLHVGTAVVPYDLDHPDYAKIAAAQFSVVTPGNEMKWQVVEPT